MIRILLHGFGSFPVFFEHAIRSAQELYPDVEWSVVLPTIHHVAAMNDLLGPSKVCYLFDSPVPKLSTHRRELTVLDGYPHNIYFDIESDKITLKRKPAEAQISAALRAYLAYKRHVEQVQPTHILFPHVETYEGMILVGLAEEFGIEAIFPAHGRNLGESFFSNRVTETLPPYKRANAETRQRAREFVSVFRERSIPPTSRPEAASEFLPARRDPLWTRAARYVSSVATEEQHHSLAELRVRVLTTFKPYRNLVFRTRERINSRNCDVFDTSDLPERFIYYPLQYSPESSINVPAAYFIDQRRVVDAVRFAMPSGLTLVVKEHPACIAVRPRAIFSELRRAAGVVVPHYRMNSRELIQKAELTVAVTGSAAFEAFLLGKPSLVLGETFFSEYLGGSTSLDELPSRMLATAQTTVALSTVIEAVAEMYSVMSPFVLFSPGTWGNITMSRENVAAFLDALMTHISTMRAYAASSGSEAMRDFGEHR